MDDTNVIHIPRQLAPSFTTTFITTTIPAIRTITGSLSDIPTTPINPGQNSGEIQCASLEPYKYAIGILSTVIGITLILLAIIFGYLKPKKWQQKGAASRDAEMDKLKKENEDYKNRSGYMRLGNMPPPPMLNMGPASWF